MPAKTEDHKLRKLVSINQACELVELSRRALYNWITDGKVEHVRTAGGSIRIFADTLYLDGGDACKGVCVSRAANKAGTSRTIMYRWIARGILDTRQRASGMTLITEASLTKAIEHRLRKKGLAPPAEEAAAG